jgi:hypothetical protein
MAPMEKLTELLSGRPDIAGELVEQRREGAEGDGGGMMMKSENRFGAAQSGQDAEGCTGASGADLATPCTSNEVGPLEKGDRLLLQLNEGWRLAHDGSVQWILQRRMSKLGKPAKWGGRRFHVERDPLLRSIAELCGPVDARAVETIRAWPPGYCPGFPGQTAVTTFLPMAAE